MKNKKIFMLILLMFLGITPNFAMVGGGGVDVMIQSDFDSPTYQAWVGPGWYYGIWFDDRTSYYNWLEYHFYDSRWGGPGWYYGVWFGTELDFNTYRYNHRHHGYHHRGDIRHHGNPHHGHWHGGGHHGGHHRR